MNPAKQYSLEFAIILEEEEVPLCIKVGDFETLNKCLRAAFEHSKSNEHLKGIFWDDFFEIAHFYLVHEYNLSKLNDKGLPTHIITCGLDEILNENPGLTLNWM